MIDYSHPRFYIVVGVLSILLTLLFGITMQRGFYFGVLGMCVFTFAYYFATQQYDRDERNLLVELVLSFLGFAFLPLGYFIGIYDSLIPTTLDFMFFFIGFGTITISTSLLYLIEPSNTRQLAGVLGFGLFIQIVIMVLIKIYTAGSYLGGFV